MPGLPGCQGAKVPSCHGSATVPLATGYVLRFSVQATGYCVTGTGTGDRRLSASCTPSPSCRLDSRARDPAAAGAAPVRGGRASHGHARPDHASTRRRKQRPARRFRAAFDRIRDLDAILSDYKPDSELNESRESPSVGRCRSARTCSRSSRIAGPCRGDGRRVRHHARPGRPPLARGAEDGPRARSRGAAGSGQPQRLPQAAPGRRAAHGDVRHRPAWRWTSARIGKGYAASEAIEVLERLGDPQRAGRGERRSRVQQRAPGAARLARSACARTTRPTRACRACSR